MSDQISHEALLPIAAQIFLAAYEVKFQDNPFSAIGISNHDKATQQAKQLASSFANFYSSLYHGLSESLNDESGPDSTLK